MATSPQLLTHLDDCSVFPLVLGGKEHIKAPKDDTGPLPNKKVQYGVQYGLATSSTMFPAFHHSHVGLMIFVSILRFMDARNTLRQLWISLNC